ncbi:MAG TPA: hypothetical protein VGP88_04375 [Thermoplasmata archaeon]|jgi:hypothetical protein|nr:hypothetical protein [Thermoplasmata archaeon]
MSGIFRRFRRPKPKEEEEEPVDAPEGESGEDSDIYPNRPFQKPGDPDIEPDAGPASSDDEEEGAAGPPVLPDEVGPPPEPPAPLAGPKSAIEPPEGAPTTVEPSGAPTVESTSANRPPLPEADSGAGRAIHRPLSPPTRCFLCGTEMTGSYCPTCRMTWNE